MKTHNEMKEYLRQLFNIQYYFAEEDKATYVGGVLITIMGCALIAALLQKSLDTSPEVGIVLFVLAILANNPTIALVISIARTINSWFDMD